MDDLISRQAAIDAISKKQGGVFEQDAEIDTAILYVYSECKAIIKDLPSVLPEGIRCKDCKHWMMGKTTKNYPNPYICELHSFMHGFERSALPEDYCSWAELR